MPLAKTSSTGHNYLDPSQYGANPAALQGGEAVKGQAGKSWQHEFVEGGGGGWFMGGDTPGPTPITGGNDIGVLESTAANSVGANASEAGPGGAAMDGLRSASSAGSGSATGVQQLPPQGASNPNLGQRIYPTAMRQLSLLPRVY